MPSPLTVTSVQSTVLNIILNILAQPLDQRKNTVPSTDDIVLEDFPVPIPTIASFSSVTTSSRAC
ncbi:hypothetical protein N7516_011031 [Penicillium verrucosum]|uniref:uncharacterized protein n=1 Tax=Penicillium verrucosum TaxID=60171 RepID=UPI00254529B3|nr:uncharacterized protein N7516_011031 [Penicillium verrucosum]KAJ5920173.1 hypothetical protein N7516_011031 [Penicillium verrucosum]